MIDWQSGMHRRNDVVALPIIWLAALLSVLIHALALWGWHWQPPEPQKSHGDTAQRLRLRLAPDQRGAPPLPPPKSATAPEVRRPAPSPRSRAVPQPAAPPAPSRPAEPPVMTGNAPAFPLAPPSAPAAALRAPPAATPAQPPMQGDLSSFIEARRRERNAAMGIDAPKEPVEDERARRNRIVAANIAPPNSQVFGYDPARGGGVFQIETLNTDYAEFIFLGWNNTIRRKAAQHIEVRRGGNSDIRIAVVRKMIEIIREHEPGDFVWHSDRLGRDITLSARVADQPGLEQVLLREFFDNGQRR